MALMTSMGSRACPGVQTMHFNQVNESEPLRSRCHISPRIRIASPQRSGHDNLRSADNHRGFRSITITTTYNGSGSEPVIKESVGPGGALRAFPRDNHSG